MILNSDLPELELWAYRALLPHLVYVVLGMELMTSGTVGKHPELAQFPVPRLFLFGQDVTQKKDVFS